MRKNCCINMMNLPVLGLELRPCECQLLVSRVIISVSWDLFRVAREQNISRRDFSLFWRRTSLDGNVGGMIGTEYVCAAICLVFCTMDVAGIASEKPE